MEKCYKDILNAHMKKSKRRNDTIDHFFRTAEVKIVKPASMADKEHFTKFIARWTACVGLGCQLRRDAEYRFRV